VPPSSLPAFRLLPRPVVRGGALRSTSVIWSPPRCSAVEPAQDLGKPFRLFTGSAARSQSFILEQLPRLDLQPLRDTANVVDRGVAFRTLLTNLQETRVLTRHIRARTGLLSLSLSTNSATLISSAFSAAEPTSWTRGPASWPRLRKGILVHAGERWRHLRWISGSVPARAEKRLARKEALTSCRAVNSARYLRACHREARDVPRLQPAAVP
jgi:hypothetical protein